jgi:hypothetical protein
MPTRTPAIPPSLWLPEEVYQDAYTARIDAGESQPSIHADPPMLDLDDLDSLRVQQGVFTQLFIDAAKAETHWIRLCSMPDLTDETINLLQRGAHCPVCSHGGNWLLHRGADTGLIVLLGVHHGCERYSPGSIRARHKYAKPGFAPCCSAAALETISLQ